MKSMREEISFLRDELACLQEKDAANDLERKRLMAMIEAKNEDIRKMTVKISELLGKVNVLTKALEDFE